MPVTNMHDNFNNKLIQKIEHFNSTLSHLWIISLKHNAANSKYRKSISPNVVANQYLQMVVVDQTKDNKPYFNIN